MANQLEARLTFIKISFLEQPIIQPDGQYIGQIINVRNISSSDIVIHKVAGVRNGIESYCNQTKADLLIVSTEKGIFRDSLSSTQVQSGSWWWKQMFLCLSITSNKSNLK